MGSDHSGFWKNFFVPQRQTSVSPLVDEMESLFFRASIQVEIFLQFENWMLGLMQWSMATHLSNHGQKRTSASENFSPRMNGPTMCSSNFSKTLPAFSTISCCFSGVLKYGMKLQKVPITLLPISLAKYLSLALSRGVSGINSVPSLKVSARYHRMGSDSVMTKSSIQMVGTFPVELGSWNSAFLYTAVNSSFLSYKSTSLVSQGIFFYLRAILALWAKGHVSADHSTTFGIIRQNYIKQYSD